MSRWVLDAKFSVYVWADVPDLTKDLTFAASGSETYYKRTWANSYYGIKPSGKCVSQGQMISNHVEYFTWFDMIIEMRVSFYKNQII